MDGRKERDLFSVRKRKPLLNSGKRGKSSERGKREEYEPIAKTTKFSDDEPRPKRTVFTSDDEIEDDASDVNLEPLSYETLMAGLVTLGRISKVTDYGITVSLPFKTFGRVPITRISQAYTSLLKKVADLKGNTDEADDEIFSLQSLFKTGQYVVTKVESVVKVEQRRKVDLCLMPQEINFGVAVTKLQKGMLIQCAVASVEDNGFVMETGISNVKVAFLKRADAQGAGIVGVGSVVHCVVTQVKASETGNTVNLKLSAVPKEVQETSNDVTETEDLSLLLPGTAVKTTVASVEKNFLKLLMAENDGVVSPYHLQSPLHQLSKYQIGQKVIARVLYITPLSRVVHLTLQSDIFNESMAEEEEPLHGISIGERKEGQVFRVQKDGVYFKMGSCAAFCLKKFLTDKDNIQDDIHAEFPIGSAHTLCVMSYHNFDDIFVVSLQKSVFNQQIVGYGAIKVGQVLQATIKSYDAKKAVVSVATNVDGEIPYMHLTNTTVKHPEKKYAIGNTVDVRVLEVKPERRHLVLTCKKLLVNSKEPVVCKYDKELENKIVRGYIVHIKPQGLLVAFYGGVKGFVPKSKVSVEKLKDLEGHFRVGNVLKCKILSVDPEAQRMTLSLILYEEKEAEKEAKRKNVLDVRSFVNCIVAEVTEDSVKVRVKPSNLRAEIPMHHLSDEENRCRMLMGLLSQGDYISNALIFKKGKNIVLTMKDTICSWIRKSKLSSQENFVESYTYPAVVNEVVPEGVRVSVPVGENTQSILTQSSDSEIKAVDHTVGESVQVRCTGFNNDGEPVLSVLHKNGKSRKYLLQDLYNYFMHQNMLQKSLVRKGLATVEFGDIQVGHKLEMDIVAVTSLGLVVKHRDYSITGIVTKEHLQPDKKYEVGLRIPVCVLHVHVEERCVIVTARHDLIDLLYVNEFNNIQVGQMARCEVLLIQRDFVLVSLKSKQKGLMAYIPPRKTMAVGKTLSLAVKYVGDKIVLGVTKLQDKHKYFTVLSNLSNANLRASNDDGQEFIDVEISEGSALELIKKVVCFSDKVQIDPVDKEVASITNAIPNGKEKEKSAKKKKRVGNSLEIDDVKMESAEREIVTGVKSGGKEKKNSVKKKKGKKQSKKNETLEVSLEEKQHNPSKNEEDDSGVDEKMDVDEISKTPKRGKACLKLSTGFVWDIPEAEDKEDDDDETSGDEEETKKSKKLSKVERELLAKEQEKRLHELESARLEKERLPQTALDYEELLQESPNSSAIWIQFISFHLENAEVDRARSIAKRALQVINVQEFEERINVWTVMLRLEVLYGTGESIDAAFNEAVATNDAFKIYLAMAMVYAESNKIKEAEDIYFKMSKKFSQNPDVWIKAGIFFYKNSKLEEGRKYMDRALLSLDKSHHVNLINRFAQLEFQFGEVERGRTMFESLLSNYPKRMDKWIVYVDLLTKRGDIEGARQVLERMTGLKLRLRQMRSVFKKFVEFEKIHGTPRNVESVKSRVQEYVSASLKEL